MKHSKEEITKALTIIADTCKESECDSCPFSDRCRKDCIIRRVSPEDWPINDCEPVWKAFR